MKKLITIVVFAILGMATQSCADESFDEVEQTVLDGQMDSTDLKDDEEDKPGQG